MAKEYLEQNGYDGLTEKGREYQCEHMREWEKGTISGTRQLVKHGSIEKEGKLMEDKDFTENIIKAMHLCEEHSEGETGTTGEIECPVCEEQLKYSIKLNGHIQGKCEKRGCLQWGT
ncbi:MAG: hypothetical protein FWC20_00670 [Oscillospiraceae bacterium]|nr:hypothetical protein [Oscillospiraceae bacterium]MCL2277906.1 hypothetical protein [Oscillospiraceae bacterium]